MTFEEAVNALLAHVCITKAAAVRCAVDGWIGESEGIALLHPLNVNYDTLL